MIGDLVTSTATVFAEVKKNLAKQTKKTEEQIESDINNSFGLTKSVPEPVFFCSIEPPSLTYQKPLENALKELEREDPSLRVTYNTETGQIVLAGT